MAVVGGLFILFGVALFVASLVAVFKPLPKLRMATRNAAGVGLALSVGSCFVGSAISPSSETAPTTKAEAFAEVSPETPAAGFEMSAEQLLNRLNSEWSKQERAGAFAINDVGEVEAGKNKGGQITTACAADGVCVMIEEQPSRKISALILAMGGSTAGNAFDLIAFQLAAIQIFEPTAEIGEAYQRLVGSLSAGEQAAAERVGDTCLNMVSAPAMGIWMTVSRPPCD